MDLREYYNLPEGTNANFKFIPSFFDIVNTPFPCPPSMNRAFIYYKGTSIPELDTSNVNDMGNMFYNCTNFISLDLSNWDTGNVTNMDEMFYACSSLKTLDLSNWDTSKVTSMKNMFYNCKILTSIDLTNWDTGKVTNMNNMFQGCEKLTSLDISNWDTSKVNYMSEMFYNCKNLTSIDLSNWDTSKVTSMNNMFNGCTNLTSLSSIRADSLSISSYNSPFGSSNNTALVDFGGFINLKNSWNGSYCVDKLTALSHQSLINILNGLYDFTGNGETPTSSQGKIKFGSTHLAKLSDDEKAIATNKGWTLS